MAAPIVDVNETLALTSNENMNSPNNKMDSISDDTVLSSGNTDTSNKAQMGFGFDQQTSTGPLFKVPTFAGFRVAKPARQPLKTESKSEIDANFTASVPQLSLRCDESMESKPALPEISEIDKPGQSTPVAPVVTDAASRVIPDPNKTQNKSGQADKTAPPSLPYKEPLWSGLPTKEYSLEVLKGGQIVDRVDLSVRPFTVFGRLSTCDVTLEHPSISRHHAVIQHRLELPDQSENSKRPAGVYLFDLGSTHGTQLNKKLVKSHTYYQLRVGHMIKFGGSSRMFILLGPDEDEEPESELTVTELQERRREAEKQLKEEEAALVTRDAEEAARKEKEESDGVSWGMGEDATEEDDLEHNPFALDAPTSNEELYLEDPKKTLRGWFEREGYELEYEVEEKGTAHFLCKVQLPLDTPSGNRFYAEASVKGKKKEAVVACALEACRILDRRGLLRQATHESRERKLKNWEEDDYYDSDEDTYLDQTGTIEKKRQLRIQKAGKINDGVETYDSLMEKHSNVLAEIQEIESILAADAQTAAEASKIASDQDELDAYMAAIQNSKSVVDKKTKTRLKLRLSQLKQDESRLRKLVNIAKPASLPPLRPITVPIPAKPESIKSKALAEPKADILAPIVSGSCASLAVSAHSQNTEEKTDVMPPVKSKFKGPTMPPKLFSAVVPQLYEPMETESSEKTTPKKTSPTSELQKVQEAVYSASDDVSAADADEENSDRSLSKRKDTRDRKAIKRAKEKEKYVYDNTDPNYAMWLPPDDQSGDGKTTLNDKFGY